VDSRLHHLQGKAKRVTPAEQQLQILREFYRDKFAMRQRHAAAAEIVRDYDFNNTYQYIIAREDAQLRWVFDALSDPGASVDEVPQPEIKASDNKDDAQAGVIREDRDAAKAFVDRWRDRIDSVTSIRHRNMLRVVLGETLEHMRFFDQALAGRTDLLGRRADGAGTEGDVLATRWVE
jgi:hypothetical protein